MGVQGFPTLKIVRPGKTQGKPIVEDYKGARSAKAIVDAVIEKIPNHVKRLKDSDYESWLEESDGPKAILFSNKGTTSALLKSIAVDFLGAISVAQIRDKEREAVDVFGIEKFPTLVLLPGDGKDPVQFDGEMKKEAMVTFLSQAAAPNPEPDPHAGKSGVADKAKKSKSSAFNKASASHASEEAKKAKASQTLEDLEDGSNPTGSPQPHIYDEAQKPIKLPAAAPPIAPLPDGLSLQQQCLNSKAGTCILALLPQSDASSEAALHAISSLSGIHHKHEQANRHLFPFYQLPPSNSEAQALRIKLGLPAETVELIALNGKRAWYRHYASSPSFTQTEVEAWIDAIRMGDIAKEKLPDGLVVDAAKLPPESVNVDLNFEDLKRQMPKGVELEMEEIDEETYARLMAQGRKAGGNAKADAVAPPVVEEEADVEHDEL